MRIIVSEITEQHRRDAIVLADKLAEKQMAVKEVQEPISELAEQDLNARLAEEERRLMNLVQRRGLLDRDAAPRILAIREKQWRESYVSEPTGITGVNGVDLGVLKKLAALPSGFEAGICKRVLGVEDNTMWLISFLGALRVSGCAYYVSQRKEDREDMDTGSFFINSEEPPLTLLRNNLGGAMCHPFARSSWSEFSEYAKEHREIYEYGLELLATWGVDPEIPLSEQFVCLEGFDA